MTGDTIFKREKVLNVFNGFKNKPKLNMGVDVSEKFFELLFMVNTPYMRPICVLQL